MDRRTLMAGLLAGGAASSRALAQEKTAAADVPAKFAAALSQHNIETFAALFADDYVNHQMSAAAPPLAAGTTPKQGTAAFFAARLKGLPDLEVAVETTVANGEKVAASFVYTGTHQGVYLGVAPTGRKLRFTSCDIFRIREGLIAEHWGMGDIAGALAQMKG
jgi:steroid delta-isomerase-like uncharacterized protein